ncbi:hypothetical protein [Pedobacter antarcticus]|uniref:hypothetical protein n=1 Tax=Pedobacter antarcticus TaxID=34086 RepID=UPI00089080A6|nr:hypothetical protein [Pedobacter antarcticus]SDM39553.1 hypothetical protein SAMN04488084_106138 [Pedobacter antarcticus]
MNIHIGKEIKKIVDQKGWSIVHFAKEANMSYRTALYLFDRTDTSIEQLLNVSKVLDYDFMQLFRGKINNEETLQQNVHEENNMKKDFITMNISLQIGGRQSVYENFPELIRKTRTIAEKLGFQLL